MEIKEFMEKARSNELKEMEDRMVRAKHRSSINTCACVMNSYMCMYMYMWQSQVEIEHYSYQILTAFSDSALYNSRLKEAMALQFVVEIVLPF